MRKNKGYIVAPQHTEKTKWGNVFVNTTITAPGNPLETTVWLGRPWHNSPKTVFINTKAEVNIPPEGWFERMGGIPAVFADYNTVDADGCPLDLSRRRDYYWYMGDDGRKVEGRAKKSLTAEEAAQYTLENVLRGSDDWRPEIMTEECAAPAPVIDKAGGKITWQAVPRAIGYVVTKGGRVDLFTKDTSCKYDEGVEYGIQAVNGYGGLGGMARVGTPCPVKR